jgi:hypothetical protein
LKIKLSSAALPTCVWILSLLAIPCWIAADNGDCAWDSKVFFDAVQILHSGGDPYLVGIHAQDEYLQHSHFTPNIPFGYVYTPITLPVLRVLGFMPWPLLTACYWLLYGVAIALVLWVSQHLAEPDERLFASILAPLTLFFPGLLIFDTVLSGNFAFILYGAIFLGLWLGWKRNCWLPFYVAILLASCCKPTYLTLLAIPLFSARKPWIPVLSAGVSGVALFRLQAWLWPTLFQHFMTAIDRIFNLRNDYGAGPAGRLADFLADRNIPSARPMAIAYLCISGVLFLVLLYLSRFYRRGTIGSQQWFPLMLLGVFLLNPRFVEYEIYPITIAMGLIAYRLAMATGFPRICAAVLFPVWCTLNYFANASRVSWKNIECAILLLLFVAGSWELWRQIRRNAGQLPRPTGPVSA